MFQNLSAFLANSLRYLNIANRIIPIVKDISPSINKIRSTIGNISSNISIVKTNMNKNYQQNTNVDNSNKQESNNRPTFFQ